MAQRLLAQGLGGRIVANTRHFENETLFWTKSASVLGLQQRKMPMSEVPIPRARAARELRALLGDNGVPGEFTFTSRAACFRAFERLAEAHAPVFIEKSPHHLYQPAALDLIKEFAGSSARVDLRIVGIVRNPIDTVYSSWRRFGIRPKIEEAEWVQAYRSLKALAAEMPDRVVSLRYEDLVADWTGLVAQLEQWGFDIADPSAADGMHQRSVARWRSDPEFSFVPEPSTVALARAFGYAPGELAGTEKRLGAAAKAKSGLWVARHSALGLRARLARFLGR